MSAQALRAAYARASGLSITKVKTMDAEIEETMKEALAYLSTEMNLLPGETEAGKKERLACKTARQGQHLEMGQVIKGSFYSDDSEVSGPEAIFKKYMEVSTDMAKDGKEGNVTDAIKDLKKEINNPGGDVVPTGQKDPAKPADSLPSTRNVTSAESRAAAKFLEESAPARDQWSQNSLVETVILSKENNKTLIAYDKANVQGEGVEAVVMGTIHDPAKQLKNFREKFGVVTDDTGVKFHNVSGEDNIGFAKEIYDTLVNAANGTGVELPVYFSETEGSVAGYILKTSDDNAAKVLKPDKVIELILSKGNGILDIGSKDSGKQLQAAPVKPKKASGTAQGTAERAKTIKGLLTLRIANRKDVLAQNKRYLKEPTGTISDLPNVKSTMSAKYKSKTRNADGDYKNVTFRITLVVPMKEIDIISDDLKVLKSEGARGTSVIGLDAAKENMLNATLVAIENSLALEFLADITEKAKDIENADAKKVADAVGTGEAGLEL